jgi:hypothetical protein
MIIFTFVLFYVGYHGPKRYNRVLLSYEVVWLAILFFNHLNNQLPRWCSTSTNYAALPDARKPEVIRVWHRRFQIFLLLDAIGVAVCTSFALHAGGFDSAISRLWGYTSGYVSTLSNWVVSGIIGNAAYAVLKRAVPRSSVIKAR